MVSTRAAAPSPEPPAEHAQSAGGIARTRSSSSTSARRSRDDGAALLIRNRAATAAAAAHSAAPRSRSSLRSPNYLCPGDQERSQGIASAQFQEAVRRSTRRSDPNGSRGDSSGSSGSIVAAAKARGDQKRKGAAAKQVRAQAARLLRFLPRFDSPCISPPRVPLLVVSLSAHTV